MAKYMSLDRFAGGALLERFNLAMRQIVLAFCGCQCGSAEGQDLDNQADV